MEGYPCERGGDECSEGVAGQAFEDGEVADGGGGDLFHAICGRHRCWVCCLCLGRWFVLSVWVVEFEDRGRFG